MNFQSKDQAKITIDNSEDLFIEGTFFSAPKSIYQIIIIRVNLNNYFKYFSVCFELCLNKIESLYKKLFYELNKNLRNKIEKLKRSFKFFPKNIHLDFEFHYQMLY